MTRLAVVPKDVTPQPATEPSQGLGRALCLKRAAAATGLPYRALLGEFKAGRLRGFQLGRRYYVGESTLRALLEGGAP